MKEDDLKNLEDASKFILEVRGSKKKHKWTKEEKAKFLEFVKTSKALKGGGKRGRPRKYPL